MSRCLAEEKGAQLTLSAGGRTIKATVDLSWRHECPHCYGLLHRPNADGRYGPCHGGRLELAAERVTRALIPAHYVGASLEGFDSIDRLAAERWIAMMQRRRAGDVSSQAGAWLVGPNGTGKTHMAAALALECARMGYYTRWVSLKGFASEVQATWGSKESELAVLRKATAPTVLVIDDVPCADGGQALYTKHQVSVLSHIIDSRYEAGRSAIIVTSNGTPRDLRKAMERVDEWEAKRITDRMRQLFPTRIRMSGKSRRIR